MHDFDQIGAYARPPSTADFALPIWHDVAVNAHGRAAAFVADHFIRTGEWPPIKAIVLNARVGTGTAWRALKQERDFPNGKNGTS